MGSALRHVVFLAVMLGAAVPAMAQGGLPARGHVVVTDGAVIFTPCGAVESYALSTSGEGGNQVAETLRAIGTSKAFVAMDGWMDTGPIGRGAAAFPGTWLPTRIEAIRPETPGDCRGEPPALWFNESCGRLAAPDLDCIPADLVTADLRLARYVTEALALAPERDVYAVQATWKRNRELRCSPNRPGGKVDALWVLSCRLGMSRARLQAVWDDYLAGTTTDLADPRSGI